METAVLQPINEAPFDNENSKGNSPVIDNKYFAFQAEHQTDPFEEDHHSESSKQNSTSNQDNHDIQDLERENFQETLAMPYENDPKPIQEEEDSLEQPSSSKSEDSSDQKHLDAPLQCISEDEVKKMEYFFQNDVPLEKNNVEEAVNSYWEKQLEEVKEMYEKKVSAQVLQYVTANYLFRSRHSCKTPKEYQVIPINSWRRQSSKSINSFTCKRLMRCRKR